MAKRGRKPVGVSLDGLLFELGRLDARREHIVSQIRSTVASIGGMVKSAPERADHARQTVTKAVKRGRRKMSAEARAKISAAQKARWARVAKKTAKKSKE